jgi:hypothetical protein
MRKLHILFLFPDVEEMYGAVFDEGDDDESSPVSFKLIRGVNLRVERLVLPSLIS